jgi:hypothetical protein
VVSGPDDPVGETAAFFCFRRPELLQLLPAGACLLGQGVEHLKDVGEFLGIAVGGEELLDLFAQLVPQPSAIFLGAGGVDDRLQPLERMICGILSRTSLPWLTKTSGRLRYSRPSLRPGES